MSWQVAALALLALVLAGGFAWYERSRPPARVVALVAALAALAAATRLVLAPVPNVVGTTDVALITGYSLGAAPGFAVGALAAAVSNLWLGQGPWTPWQMAGWGMAGLLGAWLAALTGRRAGRLGLAAACGLAGLAYGALLDLSVMVSYGGEQSLERYLALSARGVPFNLAHAAGNVAIALAVGPALVAMLSRYRKRLEFEWRRRPRVPAAACALAALALVPALLSSDAGEARSGRVADAVGWLSAAQNPDGGFGTEPGAESSAGMTGWVVLGLEAAGRHPADVRREGGSALGYLRQTIGEVRTTGDIERTVLAVEAAGLDCRRFARADLFAKLKRRRGDDGAWGRQVNLTAFGVLALRAAGTGGGSGRSARWLRRAQNEDGGWGFTPGAASDPDSTGAAMQALAAVGGLRGALRRALRYLRRAQRPNGGFALLGGPVNSQSTAWAVQGLIAAGVSPAKVRGGGRSPLDYLAAMRAGDGHYRYSAGSDQTSVWVTAQALAAVSGQAFPLDPVARRPRRPGGEGAQGAGAPAPVAGAPGKGKRRSAGRSGEKRPAAGGPPGEVATVAAAAREPAPAAIGAAPASAGRDDVGGPGPLVPIGAAALAALAATWGGWLVYRRRLP